MKKIILFFSFLFTLISFEGLSQNKVTLNEGTVVRVRLIETLDSRTTAAGDLITFEVTSPVTVDGKVVIDANAKVTGKVNEAQANRSMGRKGKLDISIDYARAVDGQNVSLSSNVKSGGKDKTTGVVAAAAIINPLALLIKGKAAVIQKGTEYNCYVEKSIDIKIK